MDVAWIQVFILTMSECVAPSGKSVCQQQEYQLEFATESACELARDQFISLKAQTDYIIVDMTKTRCDVSTREQTVFASQEEASNALEIPAEAAPAPSAARVANSTGTAHQERLDSLPTCEEARGTRPCKVGEIIVEASADDDAEVWRQNNP